MFVGCRSKNDANNKKSFQIHLHTHTRIIPLSLTHAHTHIHTHIISLSLTQTRIRGLEDILFFLYNWIHELEKIRVSRAKTSEDDFKSL